MMRLSTLVVGVSLLCAGFLHPASGVDDLRGKLAAEGLAKVIQKGEDPFRQDRQAKGIQVFRINDYSVFMNEAARAHTRLNMDTNDTVKAEAYRLLIPFYERLIRDDFREACEKAFPSVGDIARNTGLQISVDLGKEAMRTVQSPK